MNTRDSELIKGLFLKKGHTLVDSPEDADIVLFNTCSVRNHAEERAVSNMVILMRKKRKRIYGLVGCAAQALREKLFQRLPKLDIVCGTGQITELPNLVEEARFTKIAALNDIDAHLPETKTSFRENKKHAYVSIMRGCNNFCSYCIVPYVRGKERSRKAEDILSEIKELVKNGIKDVTLLGQNVNSYKSKDCNFVELLRRIDEIENIEKISFLTSHPKDATTELFKAMRDLDKVNRHLHLPLQSGSDRILKLMNRGYTRKKYINLIEKAREIIPGLRITTDIIVGFPRETEKDFENTFNLMKKIKFDSAYIFKYSPRTGTKAFKMKDDVKDEVKKRRNNMLLDLQRALNKKKNK